jgi:2'-5' RNA ligase
MRLFIAINFSKEIKEAISKIRDSVKEEALRGHFTFDENLHLTLVFLGECDSRQTEAIRRVMDETVFPEFTLALDKVGYFRRDEGDIWWVGLKENKSLSDLQANLSVRLFQKGFLPENRKFTPHVTIGRQVRVNAGFVKPEVPQAKCDVISIELMKSERINGKLIYTPIYSKKAQKNQL